MGSNVIFLLFCISFFQCANHFVLARKIDDESCEYRLHPTNLTLFPLARCLDGSPAGFYYKKSKEYPTKWHIHFEGGGWCWDQEDCAKRSNLSVAIRI